MTTTRPTAAVETRRARARNVIADSTANTALARLADAAVEAQPNHRWLILSAPDIAVTSLATPDLPATLADADLAGRAVHLVDLTAPQPPDTVPMAVPGEVLS